jgi:hypothetical protein
MPMTTMTLFIQVVLVLALVLVLPLVEVVLVLVFSVVQMLQDTSVLMELVLFKQCSLAVHSVLRVLLPFKRKFLSQLRLKQTPLSQLLLRQLKLKQMLLRQLRLLKLTLLRQLKLKMTSQKQLKLKLMSQKQPKFKLTLLTPHKILHFSTKVKMGLVQPGPILKMQKCAASLGEFLVTIPTDTHSATNAEPVGVTSKMGSFISTSLRLSLILTALNVEQFVAPVQIVATILKMMKKKTEEKSKIHKTCSL